ncbi:MAG: SusD/RagB family nutrient-binding outer membrane lipoprotein [Bacteroidota bacterium]
MKLVNKLIITCLALFVLVSCESYIEGDGINRDPNNPTAVPITAQMPAFQIALADVTGGGFSRFSCMMMQQVEGVARQWSSFNQYTGLTPNRFDTDWNNVYENVLNEIQIARASAVEQGYNHYQGVLNIMEAYTIMMATDVWDNIPYSDALQGVDAINPTYDTQEQIYTAAYTLLDQGVALLNGPSGPLPVGSDDVFFGGDTEAWIRAASAVRARGFLKDQNYAGAMSEAMNAFGDASENWAFKYQDANAAGPWYRFNDGRLGDLEFHPTMRGLMQGLNDTDRLGVIDGTFNTSHPYLIPDFLQELVTFREMQFIIAEADVRAGGSQTGHDAYLAGIKASFARLGLGDAEYDAYVAQADVDPGVGNLTLEHVMTQKYIAMYLQPEVYSDWRRTGIPALEPVSGTSIPVRWNYPLSEFLFNSNAPDESSVNFYTDRVGWNR